MSDISLPYRPRPDEDPRAASVVQANLEYLVSLFQKGTADGDLMQWDPVVGRYIAGPATQATPVGMGMLWFTDTAPAKWILLDGVAKSRTLYAELYGLWGTRFGTGDGSSTFGIPDMRRRVPVGVGGVDDLGENDGNALVDRGALHHHSVVASGSAGPTGSKFVTQQGTTDRDFVGPGGPWAIVDPTVSVSVTVGPQSNTPLDGPAYFVVNYIVYTGV